MSIGRSHTRVSAHRFIRQFKSKFTTRSDGSTWPKWDLTWKHAYQYFRALLRPGRRKSVSGLAKRVNADQASLERFVRESPWEHADVQRHLQNTAPDAAQGPDAAIIVDGMGIPKKGDHSVGVTSQWCGASGGIDNCQVAINCTLARPGERANAEQVTWPLGTRLFIPKEWACEDASVYDSQQEQERYAQLREEARIPDNIHYQPKYDVAADLVEQAVESNVEHACVLGDANFGRRSSFRKRLRNLNEPYLLEVQTTRLNVVSESAEVLEPGPTDRRGPDRQYRTVSDQVEPQTAAEIASGLTDDDWTEVTWNEGTNGKLTGSFYRTRVRVCTDAIRSSLTISENGRTTV